MTIEELYLKTIFCCIACDGEIADEEVNFVKDLCSNTDFFNDLDVTSHLNNWIDEINHKGRSFLRTFLSEVAEQEMSEEEQMTLIELSFQAIEADNRIEYAEVKFFKKIRFRLSVSDETILTKYPDKEDFLLPDNNVVEDPDWNDGTQFSPIQLTDFNQSETDLLSPVSEDKNDN